ncbi:hypothetical protein PIB30_057466 [Stylosanthes scabra]|uniref:Transposase MuDR N-terminal domain-containing protein n=1 Tax=Stylosanthes scabra TaxID=79078 RepID=A0ABU6QKB9_9FABA|nr:hypothetical protein [Stylosanthes scabra]
MNKYNNRGILCLIRCRLRSNEDVALIRDWHIHLDVIPLLELYALLIDEGNSSEADSQSGGGASRNIRQMMLDLNRMPEGSSEGSIPASNLPMADMVDSHAESVVGDPTTHDYQLNHDSDNDQEDNETVVIPQGEDDDEEEEDEVEEEGPAIIRQYDHAPHFRSLNLEAMNLGSYGFQGGPDDDPVDEFEVGQQFEDKEAVLLAVKTYSIRRAVEYKILESDRLKYSVQCTNFGQLPVGPSRILSQKIGEIGGKEIQRPSFLYANLCKARPPADWTQKL